MAYLVDHPPARSQYRHPRRATPTGCVVIHSAENVPDLNPPDTGAEAVAKFIVGRSDPGSYHVICDSDSAIHLVDFADEAFQDGTGSNPWAIAISGAFRAHQWSTLPEDWKAGVVEQMAQAAVRADEWLRNVHGVTLPAVQLTRQESEAGRAGFITHALRDPTRRSDPGAECARLVVVRYAQLTNPEEAEVPAPAIVRDNQGRRLVFKQGDDGTLWWKVDDAAWAKAAVTGKMGSGPSVFRNDNGTIEIVAMGVDGQAYVTTWNGHVFSPWFPLK